MQTRSSSKFVGEPSTNPTSTNSKRRNRRRSKQRVEPFALEETPVVMMADQRTMAELLRAPTEGNAEAIVVPPIPAEHLKLKHSLINLVSSKQFFGFEKEDPHAHIRYLNKITSTLRYKDLVECLALADLGASSTLMPSISIWKEASTPPNLPPTPIEFLKLADRSTTSPFGISKDVFVKVRKFHFSADFIVVDYVVDPRVPLIIGRPFLRTTRALIDVYGEELTLRVDDESKTFKVEVLVFSDSSTSGNPTPSLDPILSTSSPSLTPFEEGDFILEEIEACLTNDSIPPGIDDDDFDPKGDLLRIEIALYFEDSRACGFVLRSLDLQSLA
ncbi:reverse transcriptase domain-containing protein [Tanacetum coccineum]